MSGALSASGLRRLHDAMSARVAAGRLPGLVTLVARGDEVHVDTIGSHDFDGATPMRRDTLFRIGSITKPMLAAVTMMLVEEGTLALGEPVDRLLPELADRRVLSRIDGPLDDTVPAHRPIIVEDLLTNRMGFGIITEPEFDPPYPVVAAARELRLVLAEPDPRTPYPPDEWIKLFGSLPLLDQPGERWRYNAGALVLGVLLARAAGAPLDDVLRTRLFDPLGMADTGFHAPLADAVRIPPHYLTDFATGELVARTETPIEEWTRPPVFPSGAGGLLSTVDDVLLFARMLMNGGAHGRRRLLSPESVAAMTTNQLTAAQVASAGILLEPKGWGYGMAVAPEPDAVSAVPGRYGWDGGYGTVWCNDPYRDVTALAFGQTSDLLFDGGRDEFLTLAVQAAE
ncbi:serine hydrolase domain-containing protein [Catellatospora sp. NPDC049609]|uniref:serine hydrolase domain-containing protein n=1 Tax=Catellatospora sp. NPDC049609 TaxID=3155505 RepID=UPI00343A542D